MRKFPAVLLSLAILLAGILPQFVRAQEAPTTDPNKINLEIPIPSLGTSISPDGSALGVYIRAVFVYFIWIVGLLAVVMIIWGGVQWVAAAGNPATITSAREKVLGAITGLALALTSVVLLNQINPNLTNFQSLNINSVAAVELSWSTEVLGGVENLPSCSAGQVSGDPSRVYSGKDTTRSRNLDSKWDLGYMDLNELINRAVLRYQTQSLTTNQQITAPAVKAILLVESPKITIDGSTQLYSGLNNAGSAAYGIGQFRIPTLLDLLEVVNPGGLPSDCNEKNIRNADKTNYSQQCKDWLDKRSAGWLGVGMSGLQAQVSMTTYYLQKFLNDSCVNGNMLLAAAAYNQGLGGAKDSFCGTAYQKDPVKRAAVKEEAKKYMALFQSAYSKVCGN
jgi:hypothetical protein